MPRLLAVGALIATIAFALGAGAVSARPNIAGGLVVTAQADGESGTTLAVRFELPARIAAIDGRILVDPSVAEVIGVAPLGNGVALLPQPIQGGVTFGAYSLEPRGGRTVMSVILVPELDGQLELRVIIDAAADRFGTRVALPGAQQVASLNVGDGRGHVFAPRAAARIVPLRAAGSLRDVISDGLIGNLDLDVVRAAWEQGRANDMACAGFDPAADANGDGCVDIVDIQSIVAAQGRRFATEPATDRAVASPVSASPLAAIAPNAPTFTVTSTADTPDANKGDGLCRDSQGRCTLRAAITESNWQSGDNRIAFNLPGSAPVLIQLSNSAVPIIQDRSGGVLIDGYSQPGAQINTASVGSNARPGVEIRGTGSSPRGNAFRITSPNNIIRGFLLNNNYRPVFLDGPDAHHNEIVGNLIGFTSSGAVHSYRGSHGVRLNVGAHHNNIGAPALADRNVIGNFTHAIDLYGPGTDSNVLQNNILCMTPSGTGEASCSTGIDHNFGPKSNLEGGLGAGEKNVIGRTTLNGIEISHGWDPDKQDKSTKWQNNSNRILGNWIGFRGDGSYSSSFRSGQNNPNSNDSNGVNVYDGSNFNVVEGNWIASVWDGINFMSPNSKGNTARNNIIGQSPLGQPAPLNRHGINVRNNSRSHVLEGNTIRNAGGHGIGLIQKDVLWVRISRNIITDMSGAAIYLAPNPNNPSQGANNLLPAPVITSATSVRASGTGMAGATVEVFRASRNAGQSGLPEAYLGSAVVAGNGTWTMPIVVAAGQRVTALQISPVNNTSALGTNVTATFEAPPPANTLAADAFSRSQSGAWGSADIGGAYTLQANAANYGVANGVGTITLPAAGANRSALLAGIAQRDVDIRVRLSVDKVAAGGKYFVYTVARRNGSNEYRPRITFNADGTVAVHASVLIGGSGESTLGSAIVVSGLSQGPNQFIWLRARVTGASPTTISVKAWADGQAEPAGWQFTATNSEAALQVAGSVGLRAYTALGVTNAPLTVTFDDYVVMATP